MQRLIAFASSVAAVQAATPQERAADMLAQMNITEKISMLHGHNGVYVGNVAGNERLGIPSINMQDGPQGFRVTIGTGEDGSTTAWPSALSVAASWDADLLYRWGAAMGEEFKAKGANVQLGPGIGIARVPQAGRNFEYLCGEDPFVGAVMAEQVVKGIQDQGVIANAKHWVNNEIEESRDTVSANVDERTRYEIYYPPFQGAIDAGVLSVMCSYNRVNDVHACQNPETLGHLKSMGFEGWVMSDWMATHSTEDSMNAGLNQEMPSGLHYSEKKLEEALEAGTIQESSIDQSVTSILTSMYAIGLFDHEPTGDPLANVTSEEHNLLAREIIAKSTVLLKNEKGILPISLSSTEAPVRKIAVIGDDSIVGGSGSGKVESAYVITPAQGITAAVADAGYADSVTVTFSNGKDTAEASSLAASSDVVVVLVSTTSGEANDRPTLSLGDEQDDLVRTVVAANPKTVVAVTTPGACLMPWADEVPSIVVSWLPGQEAGNGLADVLFGVVNPSARLHVTIPNMDNEIGFSREQYPGKGFPPEADYIEELLVGYRYYEAKGIEPVFPFGHGLSYTTFSYSGISFESGAPGTDTAVTVSVTLKNTGDIFGDEIAQLYVTYPASAAEPPNQLKAFSKIGLNAGESKTVSFEVQKRELSIWDSDTHSWKLVSGTFIAKVGGSSRDTSSVEISFDIVE